jgi:hypothetical protein
MQLALPLFIQSACAEALFDLRSHSAHVGAPGSFRLDLTHYLAHVPDAFGTGVTDSLINDLIELRLAELFRQR